MDAWVRGMTDGWYECVDEIQLGDTVYLHSNGLVYRVTYGTDSIFRYAGTVVAIKRGKVLVKC